ncbi:MAG: ribonuclease Y [Candidatus Sumerlaeia bacterium]
MSQSWFLLIIAVAVVCSALFGLLGWLAANYYAGKTEESARQRARRILEEAEQEAADKVQKALAEARLDFERREKDIERELKKKRIELERGERRIQKRESQLDQKLDQIDKRERSILDKERRLDKEFKSIEQEKERLAARELEINSKLAEVAGMTAEQARAMLLERLESDIRTEAAVLIKRIEEETQEIAQRKARQIIALAIQKAAHEQTTESTVTAVNLPSDDLKGRIIGREGRNIRAFEAATGVNVIVGDTPEAIVISSFDPVRREVARLSMEKLVADGRIHPARIEEVVAQIERDFEDHIKKVGEEACFELGLHDVHPELMKLLGRLRYRTSYGQNVLSHLMEVARLCECMASELGLDGQLAKRAGLMHDIGKAVSYEMEGTHTQIGYDLAKKYGEPPAVLHAIESHHNEVEPRTIIAVLVQTADAISAARPGARRETLESYIKRLENLEQIAKSFEGVGKAYALQAGREVRIMVEPDKISDADCVLLARDVKNRIEEELQYPGQIKVMVLRETRAVEYAK